MTPSCHGMSLLTVRRVFNMRIRAQPQSTAATTSGPDMLSAQTTVWGAVRGGFLGNDDGLSAGRRHMTFHQRHRDRLAGHLSGLEYVDGDQLGRVGHAQRYQCDLG